MSIPVVSELRPSNEQKFALIEDIFVRGGLRVVASADELKKVHPSCLKAGMVAVIPDPDSDRLRSVRLDQDLLTWTPCFLGDKGDKGDGGWFRKFLPLSGELFARCLENPGRFRVDQSLREVRQDA